MPKQPKEKKVSRKIYFYQVDCTCDGETASFADVFEAYTKKWSGDNQNLVERGLAVTHFDKYHFLNVQQHPTDKDVYSGRFFSLRSTDFPYLFNMQNGNQSEIMATDNDTLMEQTHFISYVKQGLIVAEFNFNGARIEHLGRYLAAVMHDIFPSKMYSIEILPIILPDYYKNIINCTYIKNIEFKVARPGLELLKDEGVLTLVDVASGNISSNDDFYVDVVVSGFGRGADLPLFEPKSFLSKIVNAIFKGNERDKSQADGCEHTFKKAKLKAYNTDEGRMIPYDLLDEKLLQMATVEKISPKAKYVDSDKMFYALAEAYREKHDTAIKYMRKDSDA
jgi:hypothetical protein